MHHSSVQLNITAMQTSQIGTTGHAAGKWRQQPACGVSCGVAPVQEDHSAQTKELKAEKSHRECTPLAIAYVSLKKMDIIK